MEDAHIEIFGVAPCPTGKCGKINWEKVYSNIVKRYNKINNITQEVKTGKYIWNPIHEGLVAFVRGYPVTSMTKDQQVLEDLFNDPKRKGLVIENPNYK